MAWNGVSLDETHASSFKTKYKIYQMVREYIYVIHYSTQGKREENAKLTFFLPQIIIIIK